MNRERELTAAHVCEKNMVLIELSVACWRNEVSIRNDVICSLENVLTEIMEEIEF